MLRIIFRAGFPFPFRFGRAFFLFLFFFLSPGWFPRREDICITPRSRFSSASTREEVCRWQRWAQRQRKPPPLRVSRTRVRRVHGEDQEDQEEEVHRCGPNVRQLGTERRVRKEPGVHVRELLLRCVVVIAVVVARRYSSFFLSRFSLSFTYHRG